MEISEEDCISALHEASERVGGSPTKSEYENLDITPSTSSIVRILGSWNEAKEAADLEQYDCKMGGPSPDPKPDHVDLPDDKEWEELSGNMRWYYKNPEREIERKNERRSRVRRWFYEQKRDKYECERCPESHPACLDFHHTGEKELGVSRMIQHGYSRENIESEMESCVVLCANCHRREHHDPPGESSSKE